MIELNAWAIIRREIVIDCDYNEDDTMSVYSVLANHIEKFSWTEFYIINLRWINGDLRLLISINENHLSSVTHDAFGIFNLIAEIAPSSHGLLYFYNDEDKSGKQNVYQVYVLSNGNIRCEKDPFLSPLII